MMKIGLIDADLMWGKHANGRRYGKTKGRRLPNLALMKLSAWHKREGDEVEWYNGFRHYNRVYISQDLERIYTLRDMGFEPYVMVYDKAHAPHFYKSLQRWVNMRAIFHRVKTFDEYDKKAAKE